MTSGSASSARAARPRDSRRLVLLTNVPTPYRIAFLNELGAELRDRGIGLGVVYCALREPHRHWDVDLGTQSFEWRVLPGVHPRIGPAIAHFNPGILSLLRAWRPTWLVVAGAWNTPTMLLATSWSRGRFRRIFWSEAHADAVLHPRGVVARIRRRVLALFDAYAVPNARSAEFLMSELGRPVQALPLANCVDEAYFSAPRPAAKLALREALGIRTTRRLAAVVARAVVRKGGGHLLDAYAAIPAKTRRTLALAFAGSGPETGRWAERARGIPDGEVHFLGERSASDVRALLWSADAFVLPSIVDPNPLSAIEAAFTGTPLILSARAGNCDELVEPGRTGFSFDPLEPGSLSAALCALAAISPDALSAMGEAARAVAGRSFSRREIARTFCDRLLGTTPNPAQDG